VFRLGGQRVYGTVIEDRGALGVGGRRLLRVRVDWPEADGPFEFEIAETEVQVAA